MKAVGVVEASCEAIFQLVMSMDTTRYEYIFFSFNIQQIKSNLCTAFLFAKISLCFFFFFFPGGTAASSMVV